MDLANERLHAAAQSGDLEQLQVTWSDQLMPRRAADARSSGRAAFAAAVVGNGGRAHAPRRVRHSTQHWHTARALARLIVDSGR
jgi:hypothetical protein